MLAHREYVSIRIFEPGDSTPAGRSPDSHLAILNERVVFERHTAIVQPGNSRLNVPDFPSPERCPGRV